MGRTCSLCACTADSLIVVGATAHQGLSVFLTVKGQGLQLTAAHKRSAPMDEIKGKFKSLFSKAQNQVARATGSNFKGTGHRLGTAEVRGRQGCTGSRGLGQLQQ